MMWYCLRIERGKEEGKIDPLWGAWPNRKMGYLRSLVYLPIIICHHLKKLKNVVTENIALSRDSELLNMAQVTSVFRALYIKLGSIFQNLNMKY